MLNGVLLCAIISFLNSCFFRYRTQTVAIKVVNRGETPEDIAKREARFAREVAMLSRVQHKNLVKVVFLSVKAITFSCKYLVFIFTVFDFDH